MAETTLVPGEGTVTDVFDGRDHRMYSRDYIGYVAEETDGRWLVDPWRTLATRDDALKVLALIAELTGETT